MGPRLFIWLLLAIGSLSIVRGAHQRVSNKKYIEAGYTKQSHCAYGKNEGKTFPDGFTCVTANGRMQWQGGDIFVYNTQGDKVWSQETHGAGKKLVFQRDGNLVIYNTKNKAYWSTKTQGKGHQLIFQGDGNLVIYDAKKTPVWSSNDQN